MKTLIIILFFTFYFTSNSFSNEIILKCYPDRKYEDAAKTNVEINLKDKVGYINGYKYDVTLESDRYITLSKNKTINRFDRYDGQVDVFKLPERKLIGHMYCQKKEKLF